MPSPDDRSRLRRWAPRLAALPVFVLLAVLHTWPLATDPGRLSRNDNGDTQLNTWAIAWVAHQLPRDPLRLFDANIYYPERHTLAYSEAMLVQGVLAMPVLALGGSPVLAYNLVLIAGFALTGWAFCLLLHRWTGSWSAAYVAGSLAAFNSHVLVRLPHLQTQHAEFVPLMLFAMDRLIVSRRVRDAGWLGLGFALQGMTSLYLLVFSAWMLIFAALARAGEWVRRDPARAIALFAVAGVAALVLLLPYLWPYYQLQSIGLERAPSEARMYSARWINYVTTGSRVHMDLWAARMWEDSGVAAFPGVLGTLLAAAALAWPDTRRDARVRMCLAAALGCLAVSMLPRLPVYPVLHEIVPLFRAVRAPDRLAQIVLMLLAVVAGFGVAGLRRRWPDAPSWSGVGVVLAVVVNVEAVRSPLEYREFTGIPRVYDVLADDPTAVILELPFPGPRAFFLNAEYQLNSTRHWRPMLNGYSGFRPAIYDEYYRAASRFPDEESLAALHKFGVTHFVVHGEEYQPEFVPALETNPALQLVAVEGAIHIYRFR